MAIFKHDSADGQKGKVTYNTGIVSGIVALAITEIEGVELLPGKKKGIRLYFEKDGVFADVSVIVNYGFNIPELAFRIQQSIKHNVESMTKYKVAKVDVHIQGVEFPEEDMDSIGVSDQQEQQ